MGVNIMILPVLILFFGTTSAGSNPDTEKIQLSTRSTEAIGWLMDKQPVVSESSSSNNQSLFYTRHKNISFRPGRNKNVDKSTFPLSVPISSNSLRQSQMNTMLCSVCVVNNDTNVNCSFKNLTSVSEMRIPYNVTKLYMQGNSIHKLENNSFQNYTFLTFLDLSSNNLSELEELAFSGLRKLQTLNLSDNNLPMSNSVFPDNIFRPLQSLELLSMKKNNNNCKNSTGFSYPDKALSYLRRLQTLEIDGLNSTDFGPGFQNLTSLVNLYLAGHSSGCCNMRSLSSVTFQYLTYVKYLNISSCYIKHINREAFMPLKNLVSLDLTHNEDIDIEGIDDVFYGLRNLTTLKELRMKLIINRYSVGICLDNFYIRNFPQHLESFDAQENNLEGLDRQVIGLLSPSLKTLDVSGNRFVFGTYLQDLHLMKNVTTLKLNGGGFVYNLPSLFPFKSYLKGSVSNCSIYGNPEESGGTYTQFSLTLPPKLESIEMNRAGLTYILSNLSIDPNNQLKNLSMSNNVFPNLVGPFTGLNSLYRLDVSSSYVKEISSKFFINLTTLEVLHLNANLLGDFFSSEKSRFVFRPLKRLSYLDLSFNDIRNLSTDVFSGLDNLTVLLLKKNPFSDFAVDISHMNNLTTLNLAASKVTKLPLCVRDHFDQLIRRGLNVTIDMSECPISCNCQNLDFLKWMKSSGAFDMGFSGYLCVYDDSSKKYVEDGYNSTIEFFSRQCSSNTLLFLCVAGAMLLVFSVILFSILYRFRWKLRYLYYAAHLFYKSKKRTKKSAEFEYDAFVSYAEADDQFVLGKMSSELEKRGLKLCLHGRDFLAGDHIASNIVRAVCASRRTVVVLTRHMISSYWCKYEIQMANMEAVHTGRPVLIFLLMENIPDHALEVELLYYIRNNTYIPFPRDLPDATSIGKLWDKMVADIRD